MAHFWIATLPTLFHMRDFSMRIKVSIFVFEEEACFHNDFFSVVGFSNQALPLFISSRFSHVRLCVAGL